MDHSTSKIGNVTRAGLGTLLVFLLGFFALYSYATAQTYSSTSTVTVTACVDDGNGSCTPAPPPVVNGGGGGGGGGGGSSPVDFSAGSDSAVFKGMAYPGSIVTILKNGIITAEVPAGPSGTFEVTLRNLKAGVYTFGVLAEDANRLKSNLDLYTIYVASGVSTQVEGIFIPPTISSDKVEVKYGDPINLYGSSAPNAKITLLVHSDSQITKTLQANSSGAWLYKFDSLQLEIGQHEAKSRASTETDLSLFSAALAFTVGTTNKPRSATSTSTVTEQRRMCDLNGDTRVNILDFSIMAYWYKRTGFPAKIDLTNDGKVDLSDISILAYCWTG